LFICGLFPDAFDGSDSVASDDRMNTKQGGEEMWMEMVVA
jgi:hypothetical protein